MYLVARLTRSQSLAAPARLPRSILKPAIAPLPEIPPPKTRGGRSSGSEGNTTGSQTDDSNGSKIALRTEEEQQAAAREREERDRRDARRKSLANRRVSFAAEATLHTFHEVEYMRESTISTDSSRRASAAANKAGNANTASDAQTPPEQLYDQAASDEQRRRSQGSGTSHSNFNQRDDDTATTLYSSDSEPADMVEEEIVEDDNSSSSDSDDGTMMSVVTEEVTGTSMGSDRGISDEEDEGQEPSSTLDEALRLAAQRAGTQRMEQNDSSDEDEDEEIIPSFGWIKKGSQTGGNPERLSSAPEPTQDLTTQTDGSTEMNMDVDMEMTNAVGGIMKPPQDEESVNGDEDMSMDVTRVLGGIIKQSKPSQTTQQPAEEEEEADEPMEEATMEFTTAIGGIHRPNADDVDEPDDNEDMSLELTAIMGGMLGKQARKSVGASRRQSTSQMTEAGDMTMDMTTGFGAIVSGSKNADAELEDEEDGDATMGMDITTAVGGIINRNSENTRQFGKSVMREELDKPTSPKKAIRAAARKSLGSSPRKASSPVRPARSVSHENDSPASAFRGNSLRRSVGPQAMGGAFGIDSRTPSPEKPETPRTSSRLSQRATSNSQQRSRPSASPKRPSSRGSAVTTPTPAGGRRRSSSLFQTDRETGTRTPSVILTPQRKLSGVGADKSGLGSPRVAALFGRRASIGDSATSFVPGQRAVSFADPKVIADEVDHDRQQEQEREDGRRNLEREADDSQEEREPTLNLREMIDSLSPKRNLLKGRKSLHVGSARGLLGKRPFELDDDEEAEENDGVKRIKGHQGSPVKNIRLQNSHSKAELTGRPLKAPDLGGASNATTLSSPVKSPRHQLRFKDVDDDPIRRDTNGSSPVRDAAQLEREADDGQIHLQDFLNMTSIRFMELNTTKRRHTAAPSSFKNGLSLEEEDDMSLERCVVTGACTVPTLELYQHSCRELKKYISEGRRIVKEIETDTFEENPPLFQEYMTATPDVKALMDNQFKNVKTHARLLSKAMWYEWRMKLQDGLREGLVKIVEGMDQDDKLLGEQQDLLNSVLPALTERHKGLQQEAENLEEIARELADCDPAELEAARDELASVDSDVAEKKRLIAELTAQLEQSTADVETLTTKKQSHLDDIRESEKIREECRGWTSAEIDTFKSMCTQPFRVLT